MHVSHAFLLRLSYTRSAVYKSDRFGFMLYYLYSLIVAPGRLKHLEILSVIIQISKEQVCVFCWLCCESLINKVRNEQYKESDVIETGEKTPTITLISTALHSC